MESVEGDAQHLYEVLYFYKHVYKIFIWNGENKYLDKRLPRNVFPSAKREKLLKVSPVARKSVASLRTECELIINKDYLYSWSGHVKL